MATKYSNKVKKMKMLISVFLGAVVISFVTGCGDFEQDPTKGYESINSAEVPRPRTEKLELSRNQLFFISPVGNLTFVQGEKNKVTFLTRLAFADIKGVKYHLELKEGPTQLGAKFVRENNDTWSLTWHPAKNTLTEHETIRQIPLVIHFVLEAGSSPAALAEFAGLNYEESKYNLYLLKDSAQPFVEDNIDFEPSKTLTATQTAKIRFVVAAKSVDKPENLRVDLRAGPLTLGSEIAQLNGLEGVRGVTPRFKGKLGEDSQGRTRYRFEIVFSAKPFMDFALEEVKKQPVIKRNIESKQIKEIEALIVIRAINEYSNAKSQDKNVIVKVVIPESNQSHEVPR